MIAFVMMAVSANAGNTYYAVYAKASAYPVGAGKVYIDKNSVEVGDDQWTDEMEIQFTGITSSYKAYNKPADGYRFAGWTRKAVDVPGTTIANTDIFATDDYIDFVSEILSENSEEEAKGMMPLEPNDVIYGIFTHVTVTYAENHQYLGSATINKVCNEMGDEVTLTAAPDTEFDATARFDYWVKESTGERVYDNPLTVAVAGSENYEAHFKGDKGLVLDFPEEGGYKLWYDRRVVEGHQFPSNIFHCAISLVDSIHDDGLRHTYAPVENLSHYIWEGQHLAILYGRGSGLAVMGDEQEVDENNNAQRATEDTRYEDLPVGFYYYAVDIKGRRFVKIAEGSTVAAGTDYVRFPASAFMEGAEVPEVLLWSLEAVTAIGDIDAKEAYDDGRTYDINGMEMRRIGKGIYILNGKKRLKK